jgi:hypothetical protein
MEIYIEFEKWLSKLLENDMPDNTAAYNFNIYEEEDETYGVQLIASDEFSEEDDDWACSEIWSSEEEIFYIDHSDEKDADRERGLEFISQLISDYLEKGEKADKLKAVKAVGAGFVDGDLKILYKEA